MCMCVCHVFFELRVCSQWGGFYTVRRRCWRVMWGRCTEVSECGRDWGGKVDLWRTGQRGSKGKAKAAIDQHIWPTKYFQCRLQQPQLPPLPITSLPPTSSSFAQTVAFNSYSLLWLSVTITTATIRRIEDQAQWVRKGFFGSSFLFRRQHGKKFSTNHENVPGFALGT